MDVEQNISRHTEKSQIASNRRYVHEYYSARKPLYLETDASRIGLGAGLLQVRDNLICRYDEVQDNTMFWPIAFASKSLSSTK